jgi:uncharacterized protein with FMN-binding domain
MVIGSIFLLYGTSFFGVISMKDEGITSSFWNVRQIVTTTHADDDRDDDRDESHSRESEKNEGHSEYSAPIVTQPTTSTSTSIPATSTTPAATKTCTTVYDTVTSPSGTKSQVPRQSCTTNTAPVATTPTPVVTPKPVITPVVTPAPTPVTPVVTTTISPSQYKDGTYTGVGAYTFPGGSIDYSVSLTLVGGKISQASFISFTVSGNGKFTRAQGDAELQKLVGTSNTRINTVTGATGTSQAIQDAIDNALSKAQTVAIAITSTAVKTPTPTQAPAAADTSFLDALLGLGTTSNTPVATTPVTADPTPHTTPNGKSYTILPLTNGQFTFKRADGSVSSQQFASFQSVVDLIDKNNQNIQEVSLLTAPNGKQYTILNNLSTGAYMFKRPDGSITTRTFVSKDAVVAYIRDNNTPAPVVQAVTVRRTVVPAVSRIPTSTVKTPTTTAIIKPATTPVSPAPVKPATTSNTAATTAANVAAAAKAQAAANAAAAAKAQASAAAAAKAKAAAAAAKAAAAPKVNTTTAAS